MREILSFWNIVIMMQVLGRALFCASLEIPVHFQFQFDSSVKLSVSGLGPGCRHKVTVTSVVDTTSSGVVLEHVQNSVTVVFNTLHGGECVCVTVIVSVGTAKTQPQYKTLLKTHLFRLVFL